MEFVVILEWIHGSSCDEAEYGWIWADGNGGFSILEILKRIVFYVLLFVGAGIDRYECFRCGGQINVVVQSSKSLWKLKTGVYQLTLVSDKQVFKHWCHFFFFFPTRFHEYKACIRFDSGSKNNSRGCFVVLPLCIYIILYSFTTN